MKLNALTPLLSLFYRGLIAFNLVIGVCLILGVARTTQFFIVNDLFNYTFWGLCFFAVGIAQLTSYLKNSYSAMRSSLLSGIILQMFWTFALVARQFEKLDGNIMLLIFFVVILYFKICLYVYFPNEKEESQWMRKLQR